MDEARNTTMDGDSLRDCETAVNELPAGFALPSRYLTSNCVGAGGMGVVFQAWDTTLERSVAIKIVRPDKLANRRMRKRFEREVQCLAGINHPNVIRIFDFDQAGDFDFYVMEFVDGQSLAQLIKEGSVDVARAVSVACQIADGLSAVHDGQLLHRDIKPDNVLISGNGTAKLMDFGLVGLLEEDMMTRVTQTGHAVGTSGYMPPEMFLKGRADVRSDVYQVGVCLYESLTGMLPLTPAMLGALISRGEDPAPPTPSETNGAVDETLDAISLRSVRLRPDERYQTARELYDDLRSWLLRHGRTRPHRLPKRKGDSADESRRTAIAREECPDDTTNVAAGATSGKTPGAASRPTPGAASRPTPGAASRPTPGAASRPTPGVTSHPPPGATSKRTAGPSSRHTAGPSSQRSGGRNSAPPPGQGPRDETMALDEGDLAVSGPSRSHSGAIRPRTIRRLFVAGAVTVILATCYVLIYPRTHNIGLVRHLSVAERGARSAVIAWRASWKELRPSFVIERAADNGVPDFTVRAVDVTTVAQQQQDESCPFSHRAVIGGLEPSTSYRIRIRKPDQSLTLDTSVTTLDKVAFALEKQTTISPDGQLVMSLSASRAFVLRIEPQPMRCEPTASNKPTAAQRQVTLYFDLRTLVTAPSIRLTCTSLDGQNESSTLQPREAVAEPFRAVWKAFRHDHRAGALLRYYYRNARRRNELFYDTSLALKNAGDDPRLRAKALENFWPRAEAVLRNKSSWYGKLEPLLPGLTALSRSGILDPRLRQTIALALVPLDTFNGTAVWYSLPENEKWQRFLSPPLHPNPTTTAPRISQPDLLVDFIPDKMPGVPVRGLVDYYDPETSKLMNERARRYSLHHGFSVDLTGHRLTDFHRAELELIMRSGNIGLCTLASVNDEAGLVAFTVTAAEFRSWDHAMTMSDAYAKLSGVALMNTFRDPTKTQQSTYEFDTIFPKTQFPRFQQLPMDALSEGKNTLHLSVITGPVDIPRPVLVTKARLRLSRN